MHIEDKLFSLYSSNIHAFSCLSLHKHARSWNEVYESKPETNFKILASYWLAMIEVSQSTNDKATFLEWFPSFSFIAYDFLMMIWCYSGCTKLHV